MASNFGNGNPFSKKPVTDDDGNLINPFAAEYAAERVGPDIKKNRSRSRSKSNASKNYLSNTHDRSVSVDALHHSGKAAYGFGKYTANVPQNENFINYSTRPNNVNKEKFLYDANIQGSVLADELWDSDQSFGADVLHNSISAANGTEGSSLIVNTAITEMNITDTNVFPELDKGHVAMVNLEDQEHGFNEPEMEPTACQNEFEIPKENISPNFGNGNERKFSYPILDEYLAKNAASRSRPRFRNDRCGDSTYARRATKFVNPGISSRPVFKDVNDRLLVGYRKLVAELKNAPANVGHATTHDSSVNQDQPATSFMPSKNDEYGFNDGALAEGHAFQNGLKEMPKVNMTPHYGGGNPFAKQRFRNNEGNLINPFLEENAAENMGPESAKNRPINISRSRNDRNDDVTGARLATKFGTMGISSRPATKDVNERLLVGYRKVVAEMKNAPANVGQKYPITTYDSSVNLDQPTASFINFKNDEYGLNDGAVAGGNVFQNDLKEMPKVNMVPRTNNRNPFSQPPKKDDDGNLVNPFATEYAAEQVRAEYNKNRSRSRSRLRCDDETAALATKFGTCDQKAGVFTNNKPVNDFWMVQIPYTVIKNFEKLEHFAPAKVDQEYPNTAFNNINPGQETVAVINSENEEEYGLNVASNDINMPQNINLMHSPPELNYANGEESTDISEYADNQQSPMHSGYLLAQPNDVSTNSEEEWQQPICDGEEKHPLNNIWVWWWYLQTDGTPNSSNLSSPVMQFDTVEEFWVTYRRFETEADIKTPADFSIFKQGIHPMQEGSINEKSGRWIIRLSHMSNDEMLQIWLRTLLYTIGNVGKYTHNICGVVLSLRNEIREIAIWTDKVDNVSDIINLGYELKTTLQLANVEMDYENSKNGDGGTLNQSTLSLPADQ